MTANDGKEMVPYSLTRPPAKEMWFENASFAAHREMDTIHEAEKSLNDYLLVVLERKGLVVLIFIVCTLAATIYALAAPSVYKSTALIEIEDRKTKAEQMLTNPDQADMRRYQLTQATVLRSRGLAEALVKKMALAESPEFKSSAASPVTKVVNLLSGLLRPNPTESYDSAGAVEDRVVTAVMRRVEADPVRDSNLIDVRFEARNPQVARDVLQVYLTLFLKRHLEKRRQENLQAAEWLKGEAEKEKKKLREAQSALVRFVIENGIVDKADGGIGQALNIVNKTMDVHMKSQEEREKIQALKAQQSSETTVLSSEMKSQLADKLKDELAALEAEYSQMKGVYSGNYPKMRLTKQRIVFIRKRISELEKEMVNTALDVAKAREKLYKKTYEHSKADLDKVKSIEAQYFVLKGAVDGAGELMKTLSREHKATEIKARTVSNNIRLVDEPSLPRRPSRPNRVLIVLLGAFLGMFGGVLGAFIRDSLDQTIRKPSDARLFHMQNLGVVPNLKKFAGVKRSAGRNVPIELVASQVPRSVASDAMRNIETSIFLSTLDQAVTSLAVVSAAPGEGKSLFAVSLASVLAKTSGKRAVVVDADMRKPRIHEVFSLTPGALGLSDLLNGSKIGLKEVINNTAIENLFVVPSGTGAIDPVTLLRGDRIGQLVDELKEQFDYVVIDTPPVLGFVDARLICCHVDGAVLVTMQGRVSKEEVSLTVDVLTNGGKTKILGMILNKADRGTAGAFGHGFSSRHYRRYRHYYDESHG